MASDTSDSQTTVESFIGSRVSIEMINGMGYFQGTVSGIDNIDQTIRLTHVIHDGRPTTVKEMIFNGQHIKSLEVLADAKSLPEIAPEAALTSVEVETPSPIVGVPSKVSQVDNLSVQMNSTSLKTSSDLKSNKPALENGGSSQNKVPETTDPIVDFLNRSKASIAEVTKPSLSCSKSLPAMDNSSALSGSGKKLLRRTCDDASSNGSSNRGKGSQRTSTISTVIRNKNNISGMNKHDTVGYGSPQHPRSYGAEPRGACMDDSWSKGWGDSYGRYVGSSGGRARREIQRQKNNNTFGADIYEEDFSEDFDFEGNNKLFDKEAVAREMGELLQAQQPDVVSQTEPYLKRSVPHATPDKSSLPGSSKKSQKQQPIPPSVVSKTLTYSTDATADKNKNNPSRDTKYRCDENIVQGSTNTKERLIALPAAEPTEMVYSTDDGFLVPGVSSALRQQLLSLATQFGFTVSRQLEVTGRAAAEACLQLLGGEHRLNSKNSHQLPQVVVLCGSHLQGSLGLNTARQLLTHHITTTVVTPSSTTASAAPPLPFTQEMKLYSLCGGSLLHNPAGVSPVIDLIIDARLDHSGAPSTNGSHNEWLGEVTGWAQRQNCPVLALDPPSHNCTVHRRLVLPARALVVAALPLVYTETQGKVYLVKLALPTRVYDELGITYASPFKSKFMVTLHPCD
ncbi:YjeF N-terminal domain [Trinorchestia longiramus]|nr:YjeF N-terminal domain [Trinorchestia longiramus]